MHEALEDIRVVLVNGARQCGKSTLVRLIGAARSAEWRTLDRAVTRQAAQEDPTGFVDLPTPMAIDEIQRVPELLLASKEQVDTDPRPGRFLLTGSARVLGLRTLPDALPGRMETIELWPSQGEIDGTPDGFVDAVFTPRPRPAPQFSDALRRVRRTGRARWLSGVGGPASARRRERFLDSYVAGLISRDVCQLSEIERTSEMRALLRLLAARSGQLLVASALWQTSP